MIRRILAAYLVEVTKYSRLFSPWFGPILVLVSVLAAIFIHPIARDGSSDLDFIGYAVPAALNVLGFLMLLVYSSALVAGEIEHGTIRTVLVQPLHRAEFLTVKFLNAMSYAILLTVLAAVTAWVVAAALGETTGVDFGGELIYTGQEMYMALGIAILLNLVPYMTGAVFAVTVSALTRRSATAVTATVGAWLIVEYAKHALGVDRYVFSTYLDQGWMVFADRAKGLPTPFFPDAAIGLAVCGAWFLFFTSIAFLAIRRRNFGP